MTANTPRIPVLVVSGFLGSGKTTLVRHLLDAAIAEGARLAVITNEFGALGIDRALLSSGQGRYVELEGGCVCCELSDELVEVLESVRNEVAPDRIVIETSGVALPYETQLSLWRPPVSEWAGDDMAVVLVNAEQLAAGEDLGPTFEQQVTAADLLVLNQIDRVAPGTLAALEARLRALEPDVPIVRCEHGQVDPALLVPPSVERAPDAQAPPHSHEAYRSEVIEIPTGTSCEAIAARIRSAGALRAKGFVQTHEGAKLVQGVGRRIEFHDADPPPGLAGRIVMICRDDGES